MLSIDECRALVPDGDMMSDEEIVRLREDLYVIARLALEAYKRDRVE